MKHSLGQTSGIVDQLGILSFLGLCGLRWWVAHLCRQWEALTGERATLPKWLRVHMSDLMKGILLHAK